MKAEVEVQRVEKVQRKKKPKIKMLLKPVSCKPSTKTIETPIIKVAPVAMETPMKKTRMVDTNTVKESDAKHSEGKNGINKRTTLCVVKIVYCRCKLYNQ